MHLNKGVILLVFLRLHFPTEECMDRPSPYVKGSLPFVSPKGGRMTDATNRWLTWLQCSITMLKNQHVQKQGPSLQYPI